MNKHLLLTFVLLASITSSINVTAVNFGDSIKNALVNLYSQLLVYPQEKMYIQTDRPYYINGEKIFFRAFLLQAATLKRADWSRYIYVELTSPTNSVLLRQQIRIQNDRMFYGDLKLPETLPEGSYRLRAYTRYMENIGEKFFFSKSIYIADPNAAKTNIQFQLNAPNAKGGNLDLKFADAQTGAPLKPQSLTVFIDSKSRELLPEKDSWANYSVKLNAATKTILLDYRDGSRSFKKYLNVKQADHMPELSFFPEGGQMIAGQNCRIGFKALFADGNTADVEGEIIDSRGNRIQQFATVHDGMGAFNLLPSESESYLARITCRGETTTYPLPQATASGVALQADWHNDRLKIRILGAQKVKPAVYYLLIHRQGVPTYLKAWDFSQEEITLPKKDFATGVTHLVLLNADFKPVSERLVFNNLHDRIIPQITTSKATFKPRERVEMEISVHKAESDTILPSFAISVTDDNDVKIDTTTNIVSEILLSSELEGTIPQPAWYFSDNPKAGEYADLLMLTHGWRRYAVEEALRGDIQKPIIRPEISQSFSGKLKGFLNKPQADGNVKMMPVGYHSSETVKSDANGNFRFQGFEFPDSTAYFFVATTKKGSEDISMQVDTILYPGVSIPFPLSPLKPGSEEEASGKEMESYIAKAGKKYTNENGMRLVDLPEVVVKTRKRDKSQKPTRIDNHTPGLEPSRFISPDNIEEFPPVSFEELLTRIPGVSVEGERAKVRGQNIDFAINGVIKASSILVLNSYLKIDDIAQVDLFLDLAQILALGHTSEIPGKLPSNPVILFTTWPSDYYRNKKDISLNRKRILPLGYQVPVEFYSPRYDTPEAQNSPLPDLRSTIYWKPNLQTNQDGKTSVNFYTSDSQTSYSVVVEGIGAGRKLIYIYRKSLIDVEIP